MADQQISDLIIDALIPELQAVFIDVASAEQVGVVKSGRLLDNPLKQRIYACIHIGDPDEPKWRDVVTSRNDDALDRRMVLIDGYEIGGGYMWWRRFSVEWGFFGVQSKEDEAEARRIANLTRGRIERAITNSAGIPGLKDVLGEEAIKVYMATSSLEEGGGNFSYIQRGSIQFQVLTATNDDLTN